MSPPRRILLLVIIINFNGATSLSLECLNTPGDNFLVSSREMKCVCQSFDDETTGQEYFSKIIRQNENLAAAPSFQAVTHIQLRGCQALDLILDVSALGDTEYAVTDVSFEDVPTLKLQFEDVLPRSFKLVVEDSTITTISGRLDGYNNVEMYFRQITNENFYDSQVNFKDLYSRANIRLLNFQDIGHVTVENSVFQSLDSLDMVHTRHCHHVSPDGEKTQVGCNKQDLFFNILPPSNVKAEAIISNPVVIVPVVLLCSLLLIVVAVICFIKIKRSNKNSQLYTDNWYLRPSRSPSHSGSDQHRHSPVEIMAGPSRTSVSQARPPYERQISRVRSLSVFSSHSHIHPDTQPDTGDTISLDFDVLDEEPERQQRARRTP